MTTAISATDKWILMSAQRTLQYPIHYTKDPQNLYDDMCDTLPLDTLYDTLASFRRYNLRCGNVSSVIEISGIMLHLQTTSSPSHNPWHELFGGWDVPPLHNTDAHQPSLTITSMCPTYTTTPHLPVRNP
jgi:hypothetical protein